MALTTNIVAYWKLDESIGNAVDSVGSNTLTNGAVAYGAGKINNGATFTTGLTSSISPISGSGAWSASMWFKSSVSGTNKQLLLFGDSTQAAKKIIYLYTQISNTIQLDTAGAALITTPSGFIDGTYHHLVITYDGANNFAMYIDNTLQGTGSTTGINLGTNSMSIGYDNLNSRFAWGAQIDEVGFWSRALTTGEISQLYNAGAGLQYPFGGGGATLNTAFLMFK